MLKLKIDDKDLIALKKLLEDCDGRVTAFYRGFSAYAAQLMAAEVTSRIRDGEHPLSMAYKKGVSAFRVKGAEKIPKEERGSFKRYARMGEEHWAAVAVAATPTKLNVGEDANTIIIVKAKRGEQIRYIPSHIWTLIKFGPWTPQTLPFVPSIEDAFLVYKKVASEEVERVQKRNARYKSYVLGRLSKAGVKVTPKDKEQLLDKEIVAVNELEYYAIRKEFGGEGELRATWKPAYKLLSRYGQSYVMKVEKRLWQTLFDPSYTGYRRLGEEVPEINKSEVYQLKEFQDRVKQSVGGVGQPRFTWKYEEPL